MDPLCLPETPGLEMMDHLSSLRIPPAEKNQYLLNIARAAEKTHDAQVSYIETLIAQQRALLDTQQARMKALLALETSREEEAKKRLEFFRYLWGLAGNQAQGSKNHLGDIQSTMWNEGHITAESLGAPSPKQESIVGVRIGNTYQIDVGKSAPLVAEID
ncbi:hypothetical protein C8R43DRAFT_1140329 [Mycena crocata]|nr:hypothetical protein C8R43DRAFT_1140329 [Mycena crocata]